MRPAIQRKTFSAHVSTGPDPDPDHAAVAAEAKSWIDHVLAPTTKTKSIKTKAKPRPPIQVKSFEA